MVGPWASPHSWCISTFPPLPLLGSRRYRSETCPETLVTLRPQSALPSGHWLGENLLPVRLYFLCALVLAAWERAFCILGSQAHGT